MPLSFKYPSSFILRNTSRLFSKHEHGLSVIPYPSSFILSKVTTTSRLPTTNHDHGTCPITITAFIRLTNTIPGFILTSARKTPVAWKEPLPYLPVMKVIQDCFGTSVRLTDERLEHILDHPELVGMANELERVLQTPMEVRRSRSDDDVKLFYEFYVQDPGGWEIVVCGGKVSAG